jgi:hypothetical protein
VPPDTAALWRFLPWGYLFTVAVELPVLLVGLAPRHSIRDRLLAGLALTAFTYPIVICVLPPLAWEPWGRTWYLAVAETFAPVAECLLFRITFGPAPDRRSAFRDAATIVLANLLSFGLGEAWRAATRAV